MSAKWLSMALPGGILLAGVAALVLLKATASPPQRLEQTYPGPLVETVPCPVRAVTVTVEGQGTVRPSAQIDLVPQVSGLIVWKSPGLEPGGYFSRGAELARVEARDYELTVAQAEAQVAQAQVRLDLAREQAAVAGHEWELLRPAQPRPNPLVLQVPQLQAAQADLKAAQARLEEAQLRLRRTRLYAPFDGRVRTSRVEVAQFVNAGQPVAQLYSTERAEIAVPVPDEDLAFLDLDQGRDSAPRGAVRGARGEANGLSAGTGAQALVKAWYAGRPRQWRGQVVRAEGELDPQSRMVHLVVEVDDPYGAGWEAPLLVGMFVEVAMAGRRLEGVRVLPRSALRQDNTVWTTGPEGVLRVRPARVLRTTGDEVIALVDLLDGERVIVTTLSGATDGMKVRLAGESTL